MRSMNRARRFAGEHARVRMDLAVWPVRRFVSIEEAAVVPPGKEHVGVFGIRRDVAVLGAARAVDDRCRRGAAPPPPPPPRRRPHRPPQPAAATESGSLGQADRAAVLLRAADVIRQMCFVVTTW